MMVFEHCEFQYNPEGQQSHYFCTTHQIECIEENASTDTNTNRRAAKCPISGELGGYVG